VKHFTPFEGMFAIGWYYISLNLPALLPWRYSLLLDHVVLRRGVVMQIGSIPSAKRRHVLCSHKETIVPLPNLDLTFC
jgi:hypothetical protein